MKRSVWLQWLTVTRSPAWPCPTCGDGTLALVPGSLVEKETSQSRQEYQVIADPECFRYAFSAWLKCSSTDCGEEVVVAGVGRLVRREMEIDDPAEEMISGEPIPKFKTLYEPLFCWPMPDLFELPEKCPNQVKSELRAGFRVFWSDPAASAGRVRISLERLMDHFRVPKRAKNRKGKFERLWLHNRIKAFSIKRASAGEKLMAIKWLGNTGSHEGDVSRDDLLDGFEILEHTLAELFSENPTSRIKRLTRRLTKKHAPPQK